ncbi:MAG: hypothetical protein QM758_07985 [Armatimonas sp.]
MTEAEILALRRELHRAKTEPGYNHVAKVSELRQRAGWSWIHERVALKVRWIPEYWVAKFGPYQQGPPDSLSHQENVVAYYFASVETTVYVDTVKGIVFDYQISHPKRS